MSGKYDLEAIRKRLKASTQGRQADPLQFDPDRAKEGETLRYRFYILPPLMKGDKVQNGTASKGMDLFFVEQGIHWVDKRPHACPRVSHGQDCPMCNTGFELMQATTNKDERRAIAKQWLASVKYLVNVYFPDVKSNPEELRGKTMFYPAPKTVFDIWDKAINRDDFGDDQDPQACGCFYDENAALLFQLECKKVTGQDYNEYKTSKFIAQIRDGKLLTQPISDNPQAVLDSRSDLYTKLETPDLGKLKGIVSKFLHGDDEDNGGFDQDDGSNKADPVAESAPAKSEKASSSGPGVRAGSKPAPAPKDEESEGEAPAKAPEKAKSSSASSEIDDIMAELENE